ncbi:electron transfer flavoprotein subunit alpha/FixB family protein [Cucumibacter marinus]|uniref:electron transfer flavoprotein subunit alpha/FixB family protein n=1 Tax=Cucumibacter marinus TaxID=1121252 RepID=UPI00041E7CB6|nr:FAD-binding protein [Cucumibacter marinus]
MAVLVFAEHDGKVLSEAVAKTVTAATQMGGPVHVLISGTGAGDVAGEAAAIAGVEKVLTAEDAGYDHALAEPLGDLIVGLAGDYDHIVLAASTTGKNVGPRVAALLDVMIVADIIGVESADTFVRPIYAGNAIQTVKSSDAKKVVTVRTTAFEAAGEQAAVGIESHGATAAGGLSEWLDDRFAQSERPELTSARIVVSGGRALGSADNFKLVEQLADKLGAAIGASRAAVDAGYAPNDWQVGQTGKIVAPDLYIAVGISGAIQHLAGMTGSKVIVAIDKDEEAPIFKVADYGLVADLFEAVPALIEALDD